MGHPISMTMRRARLAFEDEADFRGVLDPFMQVLADALEEQTGRVS